MGDTPDPQAVQRAERAMAPLWATSIVAPEAAEALDALGLEGAERYFGAGGTARRGVARARRRDVLQLQPAGGGPGDPERVGQGVTGTGPRRAARRHRIARSGAPSRPSTVRWWRKPSVCSVPPPRPPARVPRAVRCSRRTRHSTGRTRRTSRCGTRTTCSGSSAATGTSRCWSPRASPASRHSS